MPFNELTKSFERVREYIREFYVYGFRHRTEIGSKSSRSYDDERRRIESWLGDYMRFGQDPQGKRVYLCVDSRRILHNPLYRVFKACSFADTDISFHFCLMDLLPQDGPSGALTMKEIANALAADYSITLEESTIRKKLKEYRHLGLVRTFRRGREVLYSRYPDDINLESWKEAIAFFSEASPLGVVGSFLLDKFQHRDTYADLPDEDPGPMLDPLRPDRLAEESFGPADIPDYYTFKHHNILYALDSEILCDLLEAIAARQSVNLKISEEKPPLALIPFRIYRSTQNGRQYVLGWDPAASRFTLVRTDHILLVKAGGPVPDYESFFPKLEHFTSHLWGAASSLTGETQHVEFVIRAAEDETFIAARLEREKRCGSVIPLGGGQYLFTAEVYSAQEMLPWIRTFIGRILRFECSDPAVTQTFHEDLEKMRDIYGL